MGGDFFFESEFELGNGLTVRGDEFVFWMDIFFSILFQDIRVLRSATHVVHCTTIVPCYEI